MPKEKHVSLNPESFISALQAHFVQDKKTTALMPFEQFDMELAKAALPHLLGSGAAGYLLRRPVAPGDHVVPARSRRRKT